jgi:hypothetical protein
MVKTVSFVFAPPAILRAWKHCKAAGCWQQQYQRPVSSRRLTEWPSNRLDSFQGRWAISFFEQVLVLDAVTSVTTRSL